MRKFLAVIALILFPLGLRAEPVVIAALGDSLTQGYGLVPEQGLVAQLQRWLDGQGAEVNGLHIFGLGCAVPQTPFGGWSCDLTEHEAETLLSPCQRADLLVIHSPPKGIADETSTGLSVGSTAIREAIVRLQPKLALCGHIHDSWGREGTIGRSRIVNLGPTVHWFEVKP